MKHDLPFVVQPTGDARVDALVERLHGERAAFADALTRHGALLLTGFDVGDAEAFEHVARAVAPDLKNEYLGTSPRDAVSRSGYVFSASELPGWYPIPQHIEMTFTAAPPQRLFFGCLTPSAQGGETPLADMRAVARDLDPEVRTAFETRGIRTIRNYAGPDTPGGFDLWKLKRWDAMFGTTGRDAAEARARAEGFDVTWHDRGIMRLTGRQPAFRAHPITGEAVWFNHVQVFHAAGAAVEYARIARFRPDLRHTAVALFGRALTALRRFTTPPEALGMHATFGDGGEIPDAYIEHLADVIWRNLYVRPWRRGDVVVVDNASVSHGRLPYAGPRTVVVAWA